MAETKEVANSRERRERNAVRSWYDVDYRLSLLLDLLFGSDEEHPEGNASLTLVTQGATISGTAISVVKYEQAQAAAVEEASPEMAKLLRGLIPAFEGARAEQVEQDKDESLSPLRTYVHFSEATVVSGSSRLEVSNLRVKLRDVSAWTMGAMS